VAERKQVRQGSRGICTQRRKNRHKVAGAETADAGHRQ